MVGPPDPGTFGTTLPVAFRSSSCDSRQAPTRSLKVSADPRHGQGQCFASGVDSSSMEKRLRRGFIGTFAIVVLIVGGVAYSPAPAALASAPPWQRGVPAPVLDGGHLSMGAT